MSIIETIAFTGHRPHKLGGYDPHNPMALWVKEMLRKYIRAAIVHNGTKTFITGMAIGVDMIAADIVIELRKEFTDIQLIAAAPFPGQEKKWPKQSQDEYNRILRECDEIVMVSQGPYHPRLMLKRDEWMVDEADGLIAVYDGSEGGTGHTVGYAQKKERPIFRIDPITRTCKKM